MLVRVENQAQFGPQYRGVGLVILVTKAGVYRGVKMCMLTHPFGGCKWEVGNVVICHQSWPLFLFGTSAACLALKMCQVRDL